MYSLFTHLCLKGILHQTNRNRKCVIPFRTMCPSFRGSICSLIRKRFSPAHALCKGCVSVTCYIIMTPENGNVYFQGPWVQQMQLSWRPLGWSKIELPRTRIVTTGNKGGLLHLCLPFLLLHLWKTYFWTWRLQDKIYIWEILLQIPILYYNQFTTSYILYSIDSWQISIFWQIASWDIFNPFQPLKSWCFLAVQNSSIGDLVTHWLSHHWLLLLTYKEQS